MASALPRRRSVAARLARWILLAALLVLAAQALLALTVLTNHRRGEAAPRPDLLARAVAAGGRETVEFYTEDGLCLAGEVLGDAARRPVVVFGHGYRDRRRSGDPLASDLLERGYAVFLFDFRGSGASDGYFTGAGSIEAADVRAALLYVERVRNVPARRTAYVGFSMGAAAALLAGPALKDLAAIALIAPYARLEQTFEARTLHFGGIPLRPFFDPALFLLERVLDVRIARVNPVQHAGDAAPAPLLLLGGSSDWRAPAADLEAIRAAAGRPAELILLERQDHLDLARLGRSVREPILKFLERRLPAGGP